MLRVLFLTIGLCGAMAFTASAAEKKQLTEEQKTLRKEMTEKYDKDKDGKLSGEERKAMSTEDKEKWSKAFPPGKKKKDA